MARKLRVIAIDLADNVCVPIRGVIGPLSQHTFGSVAINVNSQQEAGSLFRGFSLAQSEPKPD